MEDIYHSGEKLVQQLAGEELIAQRNGRIIGSSIVRGAINFIEKLPMVMVSSTDAEQQVWISAIIGDFGFIQVPNPNTILLNLNLVRSSKSDIFFKNIDANHRIGTLFIELSTRRRYRVNGSIKKEDNILSLQVEEAYANCPKYIQQRVSSLPDSFHKTIAECTTGQQLSTHQLDWIKTADTFFVGSKSNSGRLDGSHRGGNPGFVELVDGNKLKIPDYQGNSMYNTLGNIMENSKVGLLFIDFETGDLLQLTGKAELLVNQTSEQDLKKSTGTGRFWLFETSSWILTRKHHQINWEMLGYSPFNPKH